MQQHQNAPAGQRRLAFATLPLGLDELRTLGEGGWSIVDQATRTPGLLIIQGPAPEASGVGREATAQPAAAAQNGASPPDAALERSVAATDGAA